MVSNSVAVLQLVLEHCKGASYPREMLPGINVLDAEDRTPLEIAVMEKKWPCVRLLIAAGGLAV